LIILKTIPIILALVLVSTPGIVFAQSPSPITLLTDKQSYVTGDTITISGTISSLGASNSAVLQVFNTFNVLVQIGTINIAPDGTFSKTIKAEGESWANDGSYQIKVIYVSTPVLASGTVNVNFKATAAPSTTSSPTVQSPSTSSPATQTPSATQSSTQNTTVTSDTQTSIDEQIKQRIALANKLKQQLDQSNTTQIPFWVKDNARKWHDGAIDNAEFSKDIQYFISSGLVKTDEQMTPTTTFEYIPSWQKDVAQWWSQGIVSDYDYVNSIQYLLDKKIIK
jgi:hypothetical protein